MNAATVPHATTPVTPDPNMHPEPTSESQIEKPKGDPWHAFGYVSGGVLFYGALGWFADRWLGTTFLVAIGILFGAGLGIYATIARFDAFGSRARRAAAASVDAGTAVTEQASDTDKQE